MPTSVSIVNPINQDSRYSALVEDTNITDDTVYYYMDFDTYKHGAIQLALDCDAGTVTATLEGSLRDDGTEEDLCVYVDLGVTPLVSNAAPASAMWLLDTAYPMKFLRVKIVYATTANTGDATVLARAIP